MSTIRIHIHYRYFDELQKLSHGELFFNSEVRPGDRIECWGGDDRFLRVEVQAVKERDIDGQIWRASVNVLPE
jgi:hypothetical protein